MITNFRKWFFWTIGIALILCLLNLALVYFFYHSFRFDIIWINHLMTKKELDIKKIKDNKVVFVGGSSTLFGIRTKDIQKDLGIPCVNFGIHAGLETDYLLSRTKCLLKPGDTVILTVEYPLFLYDGNVNNVTLDYILTYDRNFFNSLPIWDKIKYLAGISPMKLGLSFAHQLGFISHNYEERGGYDLATLNENGDETSNIGHLEGDKGLRFSAPFNIQRGDFRETFGLKIIRDFSHWCRQHHINFYVTYASTMYFKEYNNAQYRHYFKELQRYFAQNNISTIGVPQDFFFAKDYFYDTQYHLNQKGMTVRTNQLIEKINNLGIAARMRNPWVGKGIEKAMGQRHSPFCYH